MFIEFFRLDEWDDLFLLIGQVNFDYLLVVISVWCGFILYDFLFECLFNQFGKYFLNNSLIILYFDQFGELQEIVLFFDLCGYNEF